MVELVESVEPIGEEDTMAKKPMTKPTAIDLERIASRERAHRTKVLIFLATK